MQTNLQVALLSQPRDGVREFGDLRRWRGAVALWHTLGTQPSRREGRSRLGKPTVWVTSLAAVGRKGNEVTRNGLQANRCGPVFFVTLGPSIFCSQIVLNCQDFWSKKLLVARCLTSSSSLLITRASLLVVSRLLDLSL